MRVLSPGPSAASPHHLRFRPVCGLCGDALVDDEDILALVGKPDSSSFSHSRRIRGTFLEVPTNSPQARTSGVTLCQWRECRACSHSPEAAFVHPACLKLLIAQWPAQGPGQLSMDRLWRAAAWPYPWKYAPHLRLSRPNVLLTVPLSVASGLDMPRLANLPLEIVEGIRRHSTASLLWRYLFLERYARECAQLQASPRVKVQVKEVARWCRGGESVPILEPQQFDEPGSSSEASVVLVTVDWRGIRRIERLSEAPRYSTQFRSEYFEVYLLLQDEDLNDATVEFKDGLARLDHPGGHHNLSRGGWDWRPSIWDTPTPPDPKRDCVIVYPYIPVRSLQFGTIHLDSNNLTGLTFLCNYNTILAVHAHTPTSPTATPVSERLPHPSFAREVAWVYLPIAPGDRILQFGFSCSNLEEDGWPRRPCFLFRMSLAGDVVIGPYFRHNDTDYVLRKRSTLNDATPIILVYGMSSGQRSIHAFPIELGVFTSNVFDLLAAPKMTPPFERPPHLYPSDESDDESDPVEEALHGINYTAAPLENVVRIDVFSEPETGFCRGLLLGYSNGGQRSVGDCRVGVDPSRIYARPTHIRFWVGTVTSDWIVRELCSEPFTRHVAKVECCSLEARGEDPQLDDQEGWTCTALKGWVVFRCGNMHTQIEVVRS
ncbi:hypothetical protein VTK26DRAFT_1457 [Humicola hyalothermophila]